MARSRKLSDKAIAVQQMALALMSTHGLADWCFRFNHARRRMGVCYYPAKRVQIWPPRILSRPGRIELSIHLVERNGDDEIRDTILHEIAHALAGQRAGHGPRWRQIAQAIGARPERCSLTADMPKGRWLAVCPNCKREHYRHRRPRSLGGYHCKACGPVLGAVVWRRGHNEGRST